ncbi:putative circularly permuted ATP-grasp superfamily protein/putative alpha-E superfamily protein [Sagittula marina]|uniref:Putative circularly permuted ATP-grasp superfamily protein/putative alpha-E superfamily protein n=2 Tax=Sagittula marina TaxID=943940 RepID=A0A7W6DTF4_9RHOB|nr:putative circularly permuted ATP-grasp superfamily protein/putative alpha-E superfamily protein [Sagittula marina]
MAEETKDNQPPQRGGAEAGAMTSVEAARSDTINASPADMSAAATAERQQMAEQRQIADALSVAQARAKAAQAMVLEYQPPEGVADELLQADGSIRPVWRPMIEHLATRGATALAGDFARGDQYLHDAGVYYRQYTGSDSDVRDWPLSHIPVMIAESEWAELSDGLVQRADLLERLMADLYGPGKLVEQGLLPAQLVAQNPEWLRPLVGVQPRSGHHLHVLAFEIGRSPDGSWIVLGDRTQAPSGPGFALENRMATAKVFPEMFVEGNVLRLARFFRELRASLQDLRGPNQGHAAILTPGQHTDTYFEHAYIARSLGLLLLECGDLTVTPDGPMVRTINGLEPVSVLWRRLDSRFADPLELDEASAIGMPGLVSALRAGQVDMLNALGSGVLEARALMAFLPRICRQLTGEALKLPNIATWWCGQPRELAHVRDNLGKMMIAPAMSTALPFEVDGSTALGGKFRDNARIAVGEWLEEKGAELVGQQAVTLSTTPAMIDGRLVPRPMVIRAFAVRTAHGWEVMPGGYARIGRTEDPTALAMQSGGSVADVWVVSDEDVPPDSLTPRADGPFMRQRPERLPARAADNLFWLGRYVERAEHAVRTMRAYHLRRAAVRPLDSPLLALLRADIARQGMSEAAVPPELLGLFTASLACVGHVRDRFSDDGWHALSDLSALARDMSKRPMGAGDSAARAMSELLRKLAGFSGLVNDNMFRAAGWRFMSMGRSVERGIQMAGTLANFADPNAATGGLDAAIEIGDSVMAHRRRYAVATQRETVVDLLALDPDNPRAVAFQVERLRKDQSRLPQRYDTTQMGPIGRALLTLSTDLSVAKPEDVGSDRLRDVASRLMTVSDMLSARYMS